MQFKDYLISLNLSNQTINTHMKNMELGMPLDDFKEDTLMSFIKDERFTLSKQKALISTASKYRRWKVLPNDALLIELRKLNDALITGQRKRTDAMVVPDITELENKMDMYYKQERWLEYSVMFLLLTFNTRNMDLVANITSEKHLLNDTENWLYVRKNDVVYIRNKYKTVERYGQKKDIIKSKKFHRAVSHLNHLLVDLNNLTNSVIKITGYNESTIMKASVCGNNNLKGISKISKNRGTSMGTISSSYDATKC